MVSLLIGLVLLGVIVYAVTALIPMDARIAQLIRLVAIIVAVLWVAQYFGVLQGRWWRG